VWLVSVPVAGLVAGMLALGGGVAGAAPALAAGQPGSHGAVQPAPVTAIPVQAPATGLPYEPLVNWNSLVNPSGVSLCLGIIGGDVDAAAVQWSCDGHDDQQWLESLEWGSSGYYELQNLTGECLGTSDAQTAEGTQVVGWICIASHPDQYWKPIAACNGTFLAWENLAAAKAGEQYVFGVAGNSYAVGAGIVLWRYQGVCNNQFWAFAS
jgi:hypothetical protein